MSNLQTDNAMNYVDTLYLYKNFGDHSEYLNTVSWFLDTMAPNSEALGSL